MESAVSINITLSPRVADLRLSRLPANGKCIAHDYSVDDGAHNKPPYEPRGYDLPETEKMKHNEYVTMEYRLAKLWFDLFALCAPAGLEKLPPDLRQARDLSGNVHLWLDDAWYNRLNALEQWWLFLIYWSRAFTNKASIDVPGYIDPVTGFGVQTANTKPFGKEGVTTCGNVVMVASGVSGGGQAVWCLDALADLPSAEKLIQYPAFVHAATISTTANHNPTVQPNAPKGTWDVIPFGYFFGNVVPVPLFSIWDGDNSATMDFEGIPLRVNWFESTRMLPIPPSWNPYQPARPLFPAK